MAKLKILVSSTCYDFSIVRDELRTFINEMGHDSVMSDNDDILFDPRDHTHTNCISAVEECHMVILIIGGRFGGKCVPNALDSLNIDSLRTRSNSLVFLNYENYSITQAEILRATELSIPIYTFF